MINILERITSYRIKKDGPSTNSPKHPAWPSPRSPHGIAKISFHLSHPWKKSVRHSASPSPSSSPPARIPFPWPRCSAHPARRSRADERGAAADARWLRFLRRCSTNRTFSQNQLCCFWEITFVPLCFFCKILCFCLSFFRDSDKNLSFLLPNLGKCSFFRSPIPAQ